MACRTVHLGDGVSATFCGPRSRRPECSTPGCGKPAAKECDYPIVRKGVPGTCDAKLCAGCSTSVGPERDICPPHARREAALPPEQRRVRPAPEQLSLEASK